MSPLRVNGVEIPEAAIAAELQYHPAANRDEAWEQAATALVVRQLLLQAAERLGVEGDAEEERIQALLADQVATPEPDEAVCRRYWAANPAKFRSRDLYEAAHILFPARPDDEAARAAAKAAATETLATLERDPGRFEALARERSACPSATNGGRLGQQTRGDLVPEIETFILALEDGQICPVPVASRYGFHVLRLDRRVAGTSLSFEAAQPLVERFLRGSSWQRAVSQYLRLLAGQARIEGLAMESVATPLIQ